MIFQFFFSKCGFRFILVTLYKKRVISRVELLNKVSASWSWLLYSSVVHILSRQAEVGCQTSEM